MLLLYRSSIPVKVSVKKEKQHLHKQSTYELRPKKVKKVFKKYFQNESCFDENEAVPAHVGRLLQGGHPLLRLRPQSGTKQRKQLKRGSTHKL